MSRKNWIAVASAEHARRGRDGGAGTAFPAGILRPFDKLRTGQAQDKRVHEATSVEAPGFMQVCHGKCAPLKRVSPGDRVAYYSPTVVFGANDNFQRFVSVGIVQPGEPYASDMGNGFVPYRRDVAYVVAQEASILPLLDQFEFVEDRQRWGYKFRFGLFEVNDHDMRLVARAMQADLAQLGLPIQAA